MEIREIVARRSDLSTFLVHLTRDTTQAAKENLKSIISSERIEARSIYGASKSRLEQLALSPDNQKCVCFTETPLEYVHLLLREIENRQLRFAPYGIAFPKKLGRERGINPVWYVDITPGHDWLTIPVNELIEEAITGGNYETSHMAKIAPFIEQMGTRNHEVPELSYRKEFWWEREWRQVGDFYLPNRIIVLCPENEHEEFNQDIENNEFGPRAVFLDPHWGLEQIISRLAGFHSSQSDIL